MAFSVFAVALLLTLALTPLAGALAVLWHVVDRPSGRKIHSRPTPLLGGLATFGAMAGAVLLHLGPSREAASVLGGGLLFLLIGLVDDVRGLGTSKLVMELAVAWLVVKTTGVVLHVAWPPAATALTILWIAGMANALNCLDCMDGTAATVVLAAGSAFLGIALLTQQPLEAVMAAAMIGAALGFLRYNVHPAQIFLGDAGSLSLGYWVAMVGVMLSPGALSIPAMFTPVVILSIPIYDMILVHVTRFRRGQRSLRRLLTSTGKDHLPHRLMGRGLQPRSVMLAILLASLATGTAGFALAVAASLPSALLIGLAVVTALILLEREWVGATARARDLVPGARAHTAEGS